MRSRGSLAAGRIGFPALTAARRLRVFLRHLQERLMPCRVIVQRKFRPRNTTRASPAIPTTRLSPPRAATPPSKKTAGSSHRIKFIGRSCPGTARGSAPFARGSFHARVSRRGAPPWAPPRTPISTPPTKTRTYKTAGPPASGRAVLDRDRLRILEREPDEDPNDRAQDHSMLAWRGREETRRAG